LKLYDVIVAGGGPIGSYTARKLAEVGHRVLVLERKRQIGHRVCCTGIIGQECVSAFGIDAGVILRQVNSGTIFSPSGEQLKLRREQPQACILDRAAFDIAMAEQAQKNGADYTLDTSVEDVVIERDSIKVKISSRGKESTLPAKALVIASGFSPGLCQRLGLGRYGDFAIGVQANVETASLTEVEVYFGREIAPDFFAWLVPTTESRARVGLITRKNPGLYLRKWLTHLSARGKIASADVEINYGAIPLKPLPVTHGERFLVVGDAAGQVKPTSGGGIYYGLLSAEIAAGTLHRALEEGDLSARRLASYERGWRKRLGRELKTGYWARKLFERLSDRQIDRIFEVIKKSGIDEALLKAEDLSFDWHSKTILSILRYQTVSRIAGIIKFPFVTG
jgi:digeranylgeranylglycerophospholipid reductase